VIPLAALPSPNGSYILEYLLLMSDTSSIGDAEVIATYPGYQADQVTANTPPFTISLLTDEHFRLGAAVATEDDLPIGADRINGMRRYVDAENKILQWSQIDGAWQLCKPSVFNTYITDITGIYGANQDVSAIDDTGNIIYPDYSLSPNEVSIAVGYWLVNDGTQAIAQGTRIGVTIENGDEDVSYTLGILGGIRLIFRGYADTNTGVLDRTDADTIHELADLDVVIPYQGKRTGLSLPKDLPPGFAYWVDVQAKITPDMLNNRITQGSSLKFSVYFYTDFSVWNPAGNLIGDFIAAEFGRRRITPGVGLTAVAQQGSGNIILSNGGSLSFYGVGAQTVTGFDANASAQVVWLGVDGTCIVAPTQPNGTRKRAVCSTLDGVGARTLWSMPIALDTNTLLSVTATHPAAVRTNYPDVIAGVAAELNATWMRIYVRSSTTGQIIYFDELVVTPSQTVLVGNLTGISNGTSIAAVMPDFGLFQVISFSIETPFGNGTFDSDIYQVAIAYRYSNSITAISHSTVLGCIPEAATTLADLFDRAKYYAQPTTDFPNIPFGQIDPWQTRINPATGERFVFNPNSFSGIKPTSLPPEVPGRWTKEFTLDGNDLLTQILIYGD